PRVDARLVAVAPFQMEGVVAHLGDVDQLRRGARDEMGLAPVALAARARTPPAKVVERVAARVAVRPVDLHRVAPAGRPHDRRRELRFGVLLARHSTRFYHRRRGSCISLPDATNGDPGARGPLDPRGLRRTLPLDDPHAPDAVSAAGRRAVRRASLRSSPPRELGRAARALRSGILVAP